MRLMSTALLCFSIYQNMKEQQDY